LPGGIWRWIESGADLAAEATGTQSDAHVLILLLLQRPANKAEPAARLSQ
jgi:hypothetical protein